MSKSNHTKLLKVRVIKPGIDFVRLDYRVDSSPPLSGTPEPSPVESLELQTIDSKALLEKGELFQSIVQPTL